jgi:hypothetical protein
MIFTLRNIVNQKALRNPLDRIRTHTANVNRYELAHFLKSLFIKKRLDELSWSLYKLRFQPKKKKDSQRKITLIPHSPVRKSVIRKAEQFIPRYLLLDLLNTTFKQNKRVLATWCFQVLT